MPTPKEGESKQEFIQRCIPIVVAEGHSQEDAQGKCYGIWETHAGKGIVQNRGSVVRRVFNEPIKSFRDADGRLRYRAMAVRFGNQDELDYYGTYFDKNTEYNLDWFKTRPWIYDHGLNPMMGVVRIGEWDEWDLTDEGIFFLGEMLDHFKYQEAVEELIKQGALYPSTGTLNYLMDWDWATGHIRKWPIVELSSTTMPAEHRMEPVSSEVRKAIRQLEGGLREMAPKIGWLQSLKLFNRNAEPEVEPEVGVPTEGSESAQDANDVATGAVPGAEAPVTSDEAGEGGEAGDEGETGTEVSLAEVASAVAEELGLGGVGETIQNLISAVQGLDARLEDVANTIEGVKAAHNELAKSKVESVKDAMASGGSWADNLYVASKHGKLEPGAVEGVGDNGGEPPSVMTKEEVEAAGGPTAVIRQQQSQSS